MTGASGDGRRRVVVTGMGVVSPIGVSVDSFWEALQLGRSGIATIESFDTEGLGTSFASQVDDEAYRSAVPPRVYRRVDRFVRMALAAVNEALGQADLDEAVDRSRVGVCFGTSAGPLATSLGSAVTFAERGQRGLRREFPYIATSSSFGSAVAEIALLHRFGGPSLTIAAECSSGSNAIGVAVAMIRSGMADAIVCGGTDATVIPFSMASVSVIGALSTRNDEPLAASRPLDEDRDGFVMGEGAAALVLESLDHAQRRGARILGEILGYGAATDTVHATAPDPEGAGAATAIRMALADADQEPESIDVVNMHATGTKLNDSAEYAALLTAFGDHAAGLPVYGIKPLTGHMIGAAGAVEAIALLLSLATGVIPATRNCEKPIGTGLDIVRGSNRLINARIGLSTSFGFGGQCAALVLAGPDMTANDSSRALSEEPRV